ncbi:hypothetical protein ACW9H6_09085 [Pseudomonas sp. SDO528_S397]
MAKKPIPQKNVVAAQPSEVATLAELPYPQILYAANNSVLYPLDAMDGTVATITVPGLADKPVTLHWAIKEQPEPSFAPIVVPGGTSGSVEVQIPWQWVSTCIGHTVLIWYTATVGGLVKTSLTLELEIQQVREADLRESMPEFAHSRLEWSTRWLDMHTFSGDETIRIKAWPMIQAGQRLFVTVAGDQHEAPYRFIWVTYDHHVTAAEAHPDHVFEFRLLRGWMSRRQDYSALTAHLGVIWDQSNPVNPTPGDPVLENPLPLNAQDFHQRSTTLLRVDPTLDLPPAQLREAVNCGTEGWVVNPVNTVAGAHIEVSYEGMEAGDHVCAFLSGNPGLGTPELACAVVQEGDTTLVFDVPPSAISANFCGPVSITYSVAFNDYAPQIAPEHRVKVLAPQLTRPSIEQATGSIVDLNTFAGQATGTVAHWDYAALGQYCWMWVTGTLEDDSAYRFDVLVAEPITAQWVSAGVDTPIPRTALQKLADCSDFELHFAVNFNGVPQLESALAFAATVFTIEQEDLVLKHPTVREAVGNQLTVYNGKDGVSVRVEYPHMSARHRIGVCWTLPDGTCLPLETQVGNNRPGYVDFKIAREAVIHGIGKTVAVNYTVTSACKLATSDDLNLQISVPVRLPTPVVTQATNGILDLRTFAANANVQVEPWWFALAGQKVWLRAVGTLTNGSPHTISVYLGKSVTAAEVSAGLADLLIRSQLLLLANGSTFTVTCKVTPDGSTVESNAVVFPVLNLTIRLPLDDFTSFAGANWNGWRPGAAANGEMLYNVVFGKPCVRNGTASIGGIGSVLYKDFTGLEVGRSYEFSLLACTYNGAAPMPKLSLRTNMGAVTAVTTFYTMAWAPLKGNFVANASNMRLEVWSHEGEGITGNDYAITDIRVRG